VDSEIVVAKDDAEGWREHATRQIREAMLNYFWAADRGNPDLLDLAFTADGKLFIDDIQRRGPGSPSPSEQPQPRGVPLDDVVATTHHLHQSDIRFVDDAPGPFALAETYATAYLLVQTGGMRRLLVRGLRYLDRFEPSDGVWRIVERRHNVDWMYETTPDMAVPRSERRTFAEWLERHEQARPD
jgi:hypothetical protein